jgi:hypothetical protein
LKKEFNRLRPHAYLSRGNPCYNRGPTSIEPVASGLQRRPPPRRQSVAGETNMDISALSRFEFTPDLTICRILNGMWQVSGAHGRIDRKRGDECVSWNGYRGG